MSQAEKKEKEMLLCALCFVCDFGVVGVDVGCKRRGRILECKCGRLSGGVAKVRPNLKGRAVSGSRRKGR